MYKYLIPVMAVVAPVAGAHATFADIYIAGRVGVSDFIVNTHQYVYAAPDMPRSTVVDGDINDVNATYHASIGMAFDRLRADIEASYGHYAMSGNWSVINNNAGTAVTNLAYPATYELKDSVFTLMANAHYDILRFGRQYGREMYNRRDDTGDVVMFNALYLTGGVGMAHVSEKGRVGINVGAVWAGGEPENYDASKTETRFAFSLGGGVAVALASHVNLDLEYRYTNMGKMTDDLVSRKYAAHEVSAGLRYMF